MRRTRQLGAPRDYREGGGFMATKKLPLKTKNAYIAYLDILGFREMLARADFKERIENIVNVLQQRIEYDGRHYLHLRYLAISDTIIIAADEGEGRSLCRKIGQVQNALLKLGFAMRGAISFGEILTYEQNNGRNIFGQTLVEAYLLEQRIANYPRVVISGDCLKRLKADIRSLSRRKMSTYLLRDFDGVHFVNQFSSDVIGINSRINNRIRSRANRDEYYARIAQGLSNTASEPKANAKWYWLRKQVEIQLGKSGIARAAGTAVG
jgi:hypothetical protein